MDIQSDWLNPEQTAVCITFGRRWAWEDFIANDAMVQVMMTTADHPVDLIFDFSRTTIPTSMASQLQTLALHSALSHPNAGIIMMVGTDPFIMHLWDVFKGMYRHIARRVFPVPSLDAAHLHLAEHHAG